MWCAFQGQHHQGVELLTEAGDRPGSFTAARPPPAAAGSGPPSPTTASAGGPPQRGEAGAGLTAGPVLFDGPLPVKGSSRGRPTVLKGVVLDSNRVEIQQTPPKKCFRFLVWIADGPGTAFVWPGQLECKTSPTPGVSAEMRGSAL